MTEPHVTLIVLAVELEQAAATDVGVAGEPCALDSAVLPVLSVGFQVLAQAVPEIPTSNPATNTPTSTRHCGTLMVVSPPG